MYIVTKLEPCADGILPAAARRVILVGGGGAPIGFFGGGGVSKISATAAFGGVWWRDDCHVAERRHYGTSFEAGGAIII